MPYQIFGFAEKSVLLKVCFDLNGAYQIFLSDNKCIKK